MLLEISTPRLDLALWPSDSPALSPLPSFFLFFGARVSIEKVST